MLVLVQLLTIPCHKKNQLEGCYYGKNYQFPLSPSLIKKKGHVHMHIIHPIY